MMGEETSAELQQVNNVVLYFLDYVDDICIMVLSALVSILIPNHTYRNVFMYLGYCMSNASYTAWQDIMLGIIFLILAVFSLKRLLVSATQSGTEAVITTFYSLILLTSLFRAVWFLIPKAVVEPTYTPTAQYAFRGEWLGTFWMDVLLFLGSMSLFSIFILMAIFWADLLTGIFKESGRPSRPMTSFTTAAAGLAAAEVLNSCLFLFRLYSTQGMLMFESVLLFVLCLVCSVEISRYSHRFRTVLTTLGAVNQISTEGQITRIIRITIIANLFFAVRAACELTLAIVLYLHYKRHHSWNAVFKDDLWNWYIVVRHASEALILCLMLWILHEEPESEEAEGGGLADVEGGRTRGVGGDEYREITLEDPRYGGQIPPRNFVTSARRGVDEYGAV